MITRPLACVRCVLMLINALTNVNEWLMYSYCIKSILVLNVTVCYLGLFVVFVFIPCFICHF